MASCTHFPFLSLPPELRNEIYLLSFGAAHLTISFHYQSHGLGRAVARRRNARNLDHASDTILNGALALVNHQVYHETFSMLYVQPLHFQDAAALHTFLVTIGPVHRALLSDITLHSWDFGHPLNQASLQLLSKTKSLRQLRVQCDHYTGSGIVAVCAAQSACWDFGRWVEEVGLSQGREDSGFVARRDEDAKGFCYSRTWLSSD